MSDAKLKKMMNKQSKIALSKINIVENSISLKSAKVETDLKTMERKFLFQGFN